MQEKTEEDRRVVSFSVFEMDLVLSQRQKKTRKERQTQWKQ